MMFSLETYRVNLKQVQQYYNAAIATGDEIMSAKWEVERSRILARINNHPDTERNS